ncbi:signal recognition particle subunit FFH/SRP54 (srp54) [Rhodoblastus acidophilus]|uniref:Signal recognition particle protein n=1 Tax=Rhodoblastus acidophilus TaxID=1074 RepID=A0A212R2D3_RHOAC|nr:signal recognition particle protein [Rhodoblastus acidophilus]PPQ40747.1 signal recognition particle protein [Rhodoblastus acidophilus]RAI16351.1 signal recognition particle protein [Rhodoblastus acidophilus]SNB66150.1 signal recognition particle subunit FFH/SRP54 (srp54) [Rhodoblastus acidophilus]
MFEGLSEKLSGIFDQLTRRGALSEDDVNAAMREVRRALLEADVALDVARTFIDKAKERAIGAEVLKSIKPGQMVVKIVNDVLIETLGSDADPIDLNAAPPVAIMMVGLQGAGKTTTTAKIAKRLTERFKKRVLMASLDVKRPAAQEQLAVLGRQVNVDTLPIIAGQTPVQIARRAEEAARLQGYDVVMFDTAGRTHIDEPLMAEMAEIKAAAKPHEILLVADALTGQDAVNLAKSFDERVGVTGIVLTRVDGDGRGGAALSMRAVTGKPIKLIGLGEKMDALDDFHPQRIANRILGMGDIVALVEKAAENIDAEQAAKVAEKMRKGKFDLQDMADQLAMAEKMGGLGGIMGLLPGVAKLKDAMANAKIDDNMIKRQRAIILSMTPEERRTPDILKASRKKRIAAGAGTTVELVNRLLKQHRQTADMMKAMGGGPKRGPMAQMAQMLGMGQGMPSPEQMAEMQKKLGVGGGMGGLPKEPPAELTAPPPAKPGLPGLGASKPMLPGLGGLSSLNPFKKK